MAMRKTSIEQAQRRLRLKAEQLNLRVKLQETKDKHKEVTQQLKATGGRIR